MKKFKLDEKTTKYIVSSVLGVLIIFYFVYQVVQMNSTPYKTEVALEREVQNVISVKAFVIRDESYITATQTNGTVVSIAEDGKRVGSGDEVAVVFPDEESAAAYANFNKVSNEIEYYEQLKNRVGLGINSPETYNKMIDEACIDFIIASDEGIDSNFDEELIDFRNAVTARQLATGKELNVDEKLASLKAERETLKTKADKHNTITATKPGYYIGSVDGYENAMAYTDVTNVNCAKIDSLLNYQKQDAPANTMGKLVDNFNWYLLCNVPYTSSGDLLEGKTVYVNVANTAVGTIKCTVVHKGDKEGDNVAVVLKCNIMNRDVANLRIEDIEIITDEYVGIRINNKAIREVNGEKGVYVIRGNMIQFKKINILHSTEEYSVVEIIDDSAYIKPFDTIINEGVDLYDGKVIS